MIARKVSLAALLLVAAPASAQWIGSVTPANGNGTAGTAQTLNFTAFYPSTTTLPELDLVMNTAESGINGCYFVFFQNPSTTNVPTLYLLTDNAINWYPVRLLTSDTASNSHCQISGADSSSSFGGGTLSLNVDVVFSTPWEGATLEFYEQAQDNTTTSTSGWWQIPDASFAVTAPGLGPPQLGAFSAYPLSAPANDPIS